MLALCVLLLFNGAIFANQKKYQNDIRQVDKKIYNVKKKITKNSEHLQKKRKNIRQLQAQIIIAKKNLAISQKNLEAQQQIEKQLTQQLDVAQQKKGKVAVQLSNLLRQQYQQGKANYVAMLLRQKEPHQLARLGQYYAYVNTAYKNTWHQLHKAQAEYLIKKEKQEKILVVLSAKYAAIKSQKQKLLSLQKQKNGLVRQLTSKINTQKKQLIALQKNRRTLKHLVKKITKKVREEKQIAKRNNAVIKKGNFAEQEGRLSYPVRAKIMYNYGDKLPVSGVFSEGIWFRDIADNAVYSIFPGEVVFSGKLKGYGNMIIIDHGQGYISLYGHNNTLLKQVGDFVDNNAMIAKSGKKQAEKPSLYFEVRKNTTPVNPKKWCRSR